MIIKDKLLNNTWNKDKRTLSDIILYLIIHHTAWKSPWDFNMLSGRNKNSKVSVHYYIWKDWVIWNLVWEDYIARHTGKSNIGPKEKTRWGWNLNTISIWIELENLWDRKDPYTDEQIKSLEELTLDICKRNDIKSENILWHKEITTSKIDPSSNFYKGDMKWFRSYIENELNPKIIEETKLNANLQILKDNKEWLTFLYKLVSKYSIKDILIIILWIIWLLVLNYYHISIADLIDLLNNLK